MYFKYALLVATATAMFLTDWVISTYPVRVSRSFQAPAVAGRRVDSSSMDAVLDHDRFFFRFVCPIGASGVLIAAIFALLAAVQWAYYVSVDVFTQRNSAWDSVASTDIRSLAISPTALRCTMIATATCLICTSGFAIVFLRGGRDDSNRRVRLKTRVRMFWTWVVAGFASQAAVSAV